MKDSTKKKIYFWLFLIAAFFAVLFFVLGVILTSDYNNLSDAYVAELNATNPLRQQVYELNQTLVGLQAFHDQYCKNFSKTTDVKEVRELAENYIISKVKNAYNIIFDEIHLVGDNCNSRWWVVANYEEKMGDKESVRGAAFLTIDAVSEDLKEFNAFTCIYRETSDSQSFVQKGCEYTWSISGIIGETKHEATKNVVLEK